VKNTKRMSLEADEQNTVLSCAVEMENAGIPLPQPTDTIVTSEGSGCRIETAGLAGP
jgi:hypothetical protein